ncbi:MAG: hypothetical protein ACKPKO_33165, partial [Candidatus Fonsibacter sp.]
MERFERSVGGAEEKSFDEIFEWKRDSSGVPYWKRGPPTFQECFQKVYWDRLSPGFETGYIDPGWLRPAPLLDENALYDAKGNRDRVGHIMDYLPDDQELRGISLYDLRHYIELDVGR